MAKSPTTTDDERLAEISARIGELAAETKALDWQHSHPEAGFVGVRAFDPAKGIPGVGTPFRVLPSLEPTLRVHLATKIRWLFFSKDAELESLRAERARLTLDRLPDLDELAAACDAALTESKRLKAEYERARAHFWNLNAQKEHAIQRAGELARAITDHEAEAAKSAGRAEQHRAELERLEPFVPEAVRVLGTGGE